jgi:hypothetical protein
MPNAVKFFALVAATLLSLLVLRWTNVLAFNRSR